MISPSLRRRFLASVLLGVAVSAGLVFYGDLHNILAALGSFHWEYTPAILGLTLLNYFIRFGKWHFYARRLGATDLRLSDSMLMFFAGLAMTITPGKVGEWLKCYLLREATGVPFTRSAPIILAERVTDGLAMALLASGGLILFGVGWQMVAAMYVLAALVVAAVMYEPLGTAVLGRLERFPRIGARVRHMHEFLFGARALFSPGLLAAAVALGVLSWGGECLAFWLVALGLGVPATPTTAIGATFILAASTIGGSLLMTPGGLGVAEGGLTGLSQLLLGMDKDAAATGALLIRVFTLWFGVLLGIVCLALVTRRMARRTGPPESPAALAESGAR